MPASRSPVSPVRPVHRRRGAPVPGHRQVNRQLKLKPVIDCRQLERLSAALEALGVVSISFEGEFPGITASAAPSLSAEDAQALLDSTLPLVAAQDTCRVYQGTGDFLLFTTSNNAADWNVQYVINADHNVLTPYLIKFIAEFETKSSEPECWTQHRERSISTSVPYFYTQTIFPQKQETLHEFLFRDGVRFSVTTADSEKILRIETTIDDSIRNLFNGRYFLTECLY